MRSRTGSLLIPVVAFGLFLSSSRAWADCADDAQCKGDRICQNGLCVDPPVVAPGYDVPPPPPPPPPWVPHRLHGARSYGAFGGVGDFLAPTFGGVHVEGQHIFRFFNADVVDGGLTLNLLDDFALANGRPINPFYASIAGGIGFDIGLARFLQLGPRFDIGYGSDLTGLTNLGGGFFSFGGHVIAWFSRVAGIYVEADRLLPMTADAPAGVRFAGGFAFSWD